MISGFNELIHTIYDKILTLGIIIMRIVRRRPRERNVRRRPATMRSRCYVFRPYQLIPVEPRNAEAPDEGGPFTPFARSGHRIVCTESDLFLLGGYNPEFNLERNSERGEPDADRPLMPICRELWKFNYQSCIWQLCISGQQGVDMPNELASSAVTIKGKLIIVFGGTGFPFGQTCSNQCCFIKVRRDMAQACEVERLAAGGDPPIPQYGSTIVVHDNYLYAIGGTTGFEYSCDVYRLSLETKLWECAYICRPEKCDPCGRYRHEIAYDGEVVYILGGGTIDNVFSLSSLPAFNLKSLEWSMVQTKPDPTSGTPDGYPRPRKCHTCVQYQTEDGLEAVITGGCGDNRNYWDIWKISFRTMQWRQLTSALPNPTYFHAAGTSGNGCMYLFGGIEGDRSMVRTDNFYKMWTTIPKLGEICWDAVCFYNPNLHRYPKSVLLQSGIPRRFIDRVP